MAQQRRWPKERKGTTKIIVKLNEETHNAYLLTEGIKNVCEQASCQAMKEAWQDINPTLSLIRGQIVIVCDWNAKERTATPIIGTKTAKVVCVNRRQRWTRPQPHPP